MRLPPTLKAAVAGLVAGAWAAGVAGAADGVSYHEHVAPILHRHCVGCHRPEDSAPFPLLTYGDARKHGREMVDVTERRYMPPWLPAPGHGEFENERRLTPEEIAVFRRWRDAGMPEGEPARAVPPPPVASGWDLGPPDLVIRMPDAYTVPASGRDVYRHFVIPVPPDRRRWVSAWQFRPRSRAVHHVFLRLDSSGEARRRDLADPEPGFPGMDTPVGVESPPGHFASWQPGAGVRRIRQGLAWALPPGVDVVVQMHLQPLGKPEALQSEIGFYFTDQPPTNQPVKVALVNFGFSLPAGASNTVVGDDLTLPAPARLLGLLPHTHYLGRRIEAQAHLPGGAVQPLFLIPDWDFNWQGDYAFRSPPVLPAGTRISMEIAFDNSTGNPRNPSVPPRAVRYGPNTTDEMAELWLQLLPVDTADIPRFRQWSGERVMRDSQSVNEQRLRINPNDGDARINLGRILLARRRPEEARGQFMAALEANPKSDDAHYYLGILHRLAGRTDDAIGEFRRAVELNPANARAVGNLGLLHVGRDEIDTGVRYLTEAIRLNPNDAIAVSTLGSIRLQQGRAAEALGLLEVAARLQPEDTEIRQDLERARRQAGQGPLAPP